MNCFYLETICSCSYVICFYSEMICCCSGNICFLVERISLLFRRALLALKANLTGVCAAPPPRLFEAGSFGSGTAQSSLLHVTGQQVTVPRGMTTCWRRSMTTPRIRRSGFSPAWRIARLGSAVRRAAWCRKDRGVRSYQAPFVQIGVVRREAEPNLYMF